MDTLIIIAIMLLVGRIFFTRTFIGRTVILLLKAAVEVIEMIYFSAKLLHKKIRNVNGKMKGKLQEPEKVRYNNVIELKKKRAK